MDNKQAIEELYKICGDLAVYGTNDFVEPMNLAFKALEENDNLRAEIERLKENSVQLPCKVGDTLYIIDGKQDIIDFEVYSILHQQEAENHSVFIRKKITGNHNAFVHDFDFSDVGKTAFLTREEAEKALKEREVSE